MKYFFYIIFSISILILWSSCRKDLEFTPSNGMLEFSKDTVFLDTVFTNTSSSTHLLKVYNRSNEDIEVPSIQLAQGENSSYRLNVDGEAGKIFKNIPLQANDSIFIFIESTFDVSQTHQNSFLNTDVIQFNPANNLQEVALITLVKDAIFLFPKTLAEGTKEKLTINTNNSSDSISVEGFYLPDEQLNFTNEKPYVIYGYAAVPTGKQLNIAAGTRVHFHKNSGIIVQSGGTIKINGTLSSNSEAMEREVVFQGDRLETEFDNVPGQWGTILIASGSINNSINHLTIRNATVGILAEGDGQLASPTLNIKNTQIVNSSTINLWGKTAFIKGENLVLGGAGDISLYCNLGGAYSFIHTTIANHWQHGFRTGSALEIDNFNTTDSADLVQANFINCIIDGNTSIELNLNSNEIKTFNFAFTNSMIKFNDTGNQFITNFLYDFEDTAYYNEVLLNEDPNFFDININNFKIATPSPAQDKASFEGANLVPTDLLGRNRTGSPDIGAYEAEIPE